MTSSTALIVGLSVGLGVGLLVVVSLGLLTGVLIRRHWRKERQRSMDRANTKLWQADPNATYLEKTYEHPVDDEERMAHVLYNVPEASHSTEEGQTQPPAGDVSPRTMPRPLPTDDDVRFPSAPIAEQAQQPSVQWTRSTVPAALRSGAQPPPQSRQASSKYKLPLSRSRSRMLSMRLGSPRNSWVSHRRSVLSRFPSQFRSARSSRRVSPDSQYEGSIGHPDGSIPMARRIGRNETRFQYDSSSYASSPRVEWDDYNPEPETTYMAEPQTADVPVPAPAVPAPAVLAPQREPEDREAFLQARIAAWQETSLNAGSPNEAEEDELPELPALKTAPLQRSATQSTVQSAYSHASGEDLVNPYMERESSLVRIPSIRPQFAAETTLESWLGPDDPRHVAASSAGHDSGLFGEVEFATAHGSSSEAHSAAPSTTHAMPGMLSVPPVPVRAAAPAEQPYAPRTPSPLGMHLVPAATPHGAYAPSSSSRSSFPASARMSNDLPRSWKHNSNATASTEITWAEDASLANDGSPGAALVKLERERSLRSAAADRVAQANKAWGVDAPEPARAERVLLPVQGPRTMPSGRASPGSSSASSESVATNTAETHVHLSPIDAGSPLLASPLQTMQAWFNIPSSDKADGVHPEPPAVLS